MELVDVLQRDVKIFAQKLLPRLIEDFAGPFSDELRLGNEVRVTILSSYRRCLHHHRPKASPTPPALPQIHWAHLENL